MQKRNIKDQGTAWTMHTLYSDIDQVITFRALCRPRGMNPGANFGFGPIAFDLERPNLAR